MAELFHNPGERGIPTNDFIVLLPFKSVEYRRDPEPGVSIYTQVMVFGDIYHQARHNEQRHVFDLVPKGFPSDYDGMEIQFGNVAMLLEAQAIVLGAVRCTDCPWPVIVPLVDPGTGNGGS